jgi:hypothetical protein
LEDNNVATKKETIPLQSLLPLPVPKSPSESWLSRTLPSVTNKPPLPSFLGIQVHSKKQALWATIQPKENDHKPSRPRQIRFADVRINFLLLCIYLYVLLSFFFTCSRVMEPLLICMCEFICLGGRNTNFIGLGDMTSSCKTSIYPFRVLMPWRLSGSYTSPALNELPRCSSSFYRCGHFDAAAGCHLPCWQLEFTCHVCWTMVSMFFMVIW